MLKRLSVVNNLYVNSLGIGSVLQLGDSTNIRPQARALAVQREYQLFFEEEGNFYSYPIFTEPIPQPLFYEKVYMAEFNEKPIIKVNNVSVTAVSSSAVVQVGSTGDITSESRVKHIRQLLE
ncbi:spore germination protein GerPE [Cytobacillus sp. S13-E01]|uniref:spore germination protein GerPE n=1 Tax=Cytobacillus sp. S13-E01 TaxID=3031326 RepID=UPI0023D8269D|nr:spore germination protein GerPE [Cytobacillus sp. S13-E01]MDF0726960.1 spore germination protein GerPE [Cytobacillus sp. S13-E01]